MKKFGSRWVALGFALCSSLGMAGSATDGFIYQTLTPAEQEQLRKISELTGPRGIQARTIPPRNREIKASYLPMQDAELWKHVVRSRQTVVVAIKEPGSSRGFYASSRLVSDRTLRGAVKELLSIKGVSRPDLADGGALKLPPMSNGLPYPGVVLRLANAKVLQQVRRLPYIDFVEPLYPRVDYLQIGCGVGPYAGSPSDRSLRAGGVSNLVPWNYAHHAIPEAWALFPAPGAPGVGVDFYIMDTGVYPTQRQFSDFFSPPTTSVPRVFVRQLWGGDPRTKCSHGTRIAGLAVAPADASAAPNIAGIGWGSSAVAMKIGDGVLQVDTPSTSIAGAFLEAASGSALPLSNKRVVLMAWGMPWESQLVRDAIVDAYDSNPNLIMVAAAGTAVPFTVFPATMRRETVAVSLVEAANPAQMKYDLIPVTAGSDMVAYGESVDFVAVNNVSRPLYIPTTGAGVDSAGMSVDEDGNLVPASSSLATKTLETVTLAGSSSAVSIIGGGIALAWSRMPGLTRDQLLARVVAASNCGSISSLSGACKDGGNKYAVGAGVPDFYRAAGGARTLWIDGPPPVGPGTPFQIEAGMDGDPAQYDFSWTTGAAGSSITLNLQPGQSLTVGVTAVNRNDRSTLAASRPFSALPTTSRTLFATATVESWASFLDGHRLDRSVNVGATLPAGCYLTGAAGQEETIGGPVPGSAFGAPVPVANYANRGFTVSRTGSSPQSLDVLVHAWHDGFSAVRVRPAYFVQETAGVDCNSGGATQTTP